MLKARVLPTLLVRGVNLVKGEGFDSWRSIGSPMQSVKVFNRRDVDELVLLDITATSEDKGPDLAMVAAMSAECFVPLTVGGGISDISQIRELLRVGADKVSINSAAYKTPGLITQAASAFGSQCIIGGIDYRTGADGSRECYSHSGTVAQRRDPVSWAKELQELGAGEVQLTAIERDGTMTGYDLDTIKAVSEAVSIPVIASGGAKDFADMATALEHGAAAVSASSLYLFTQATPLEAKAYLAEVGLPIRRHQEV